MYVHNAYCVKNKKIKKFLQNRDMDNYTFPNFNACFLKSNNM